MNKKYEYGGLIYCEDDLSEKIDNYGGSLYDLFITWKAMAEQDMQRFITKKKVMNLMKITKI